MDELSIYNGVIPVKDYIRKVAEAYELTEPETVMLLQVFTEWMAIERQPGEPITLSCLVRSIEYAGNRLGSPARTHLNNIAADVGLQDPRALLALDAVEVEDDHG